MDLRQVAAVAHVEPEQQHRRLVVVGFDIHMVDVAEGRGYPAGHVGEQADPVEGPDPDLRLELARDALAPVHRNPLGGLLPEAGDVVALVAVDDHAPPAGHVADDAVARYRVAAARVRHQQPLGAGDFQRLLLHFGVALLAQLLGQHAGHHGRETLAHPDLLVDFGHVRNAQLLQQADPLDLPQAAQVQRVGPERLAEQPLAQPRAPLRASGS